ncbi:MAG: MEKHLA domain-containing protein [Gallionella sp.]
MPSSLPRDAVPDERLRLIVESYRRLTGKHLLDTHPLPCRERAGERVEALSSLDSTPILTVPLQGGRNIEPDALLRHALWQAPRTIVAHGTEDDPVFFYGNRLALELFEMSFEDFTQLPSRYSAEPLERDTRARLLERVTRRGYVDDYSGVRIAASGKRFMIEAATVWNLIDEAGNHRGQAATFSDWRAL